MDSEVRSYRTGGHDVVLDLTRDCTEFVSGEKDGLLHVFVPHATAGVAVIETGAGSDDDLLAALDDGRLGGVGLDVFEEEPPDPSHPLFAHPRVVATPHALGQTVGAREQVFRTMAEGVAAVLRGERPPHIAVPAVSAP